MASKLKNAWHKIEEFLAPSDWGGQRWNEFQSRNDNPYEAYSVSFKEISKELRLIYHMMGGVQTKTLYATDKSSRLSLRSFMQKATGDKATFHICWQDKRGLYLPRQIELFSSRNLNKMYYVWMVALMANARVNVENWAEENVRVQNWYIELSDTTKEEKREICLDIKEYAQKVELMGEEYNGEVEVAWSTDEGVTVEQINEVRQQIMAYEAEIEASSSAN